MWLWWFDKLMIDIFVTKAIFQNIITKRLIVINVFSEVSIIFPRIFPKLCKIISTYLRNRIDISYASTKGVSGHPTVFPMIYSMHVRNAILIIFKSSFNEHFYCSTNQDRGESTMKCNTFTLTFRYELSCSFFVKMMIYVSLKSSKCLDLSEDMHPEN